MDGGTIAAVVLGSVIGVYVVGWCLTCTCLSRMHTPTGQLGDGVTPVFDVAAATCWPCLCVGALVAAVTNTLAWCFRGCRSKPDPSAPTGV